MQKLIRFSILMLILIWAGCEKYPIPEYKVVTEKKTEAGKSLALIVPEPLTKEHYMAFVQKLAKEKRASNIQIYASKAAYEAVQEPNENEDYRKGFILVYRKGQEGNAEIWWMQEKGALASLYGKVTPMP